ncbi:MAG: hypothetical protein U0R17_06325 [Acidimicrobiia bacterium]
MIYECVINVSEGQNLDKIDQIKQHTGKTLKNVHYDTDHNRSVFTLASSSLEDISSSARDLTDKALELIEIKNHDGVHPRLGVVDVVPFISYNSENSQPTHETISASIEYGHWINAAHNIPVFFYDYSSKKLLTLPFVRKNAFVNLEPSISGLHHEKFGATCVGSREPLIAINVNLDSDNLALAKQFAKELRESSGGEKGVRAIGLELNNQHCVQVSMNIIDSYHVNAGEICLKIKSWSEQLSIQAHVDLVGLVPQHQYNMWSEEFKSWSKLDNEVVVENFL